jgi:hypothetical protein
VSPLVDYFARRDGENPMQALDLLAPDVRFHLMPQPGIELAGVGRETLRTALSNVSGPLPTHDVRGVCDADGLQFVLGHRVVDGRRLGTFVAVATADARGLIDGYVGAYFAGTLLVPGSNAGKL